MGDCRESLRDRDGHRHQWLTAGEPCQHLDQCTQKNHRAYWRHTIAPLSKCCAHSSLSQLIHQRLQQDLDGVPLLAVEWSCLRTLFLLSSRWPRLDGTISTLHHSLAKAQAALAHTRGWQESGDLWPPENWSQHPVVWGTGVTWSWTRGPPGVFSWHSQALPALATGGPWHRSFQNLRGLESFDEGLESAQLGQRFWELSKIGHKRDFAFFFGIWNLNNEIKVALNAMQHKVPLRSFKFLLSAPWSPFSIDLVHWLPKTNCALLTVCYCVLLCANCVKRSITALHTVSNAQLIECLQLTISYSQWAHSSSTHSKTTEHTVNCVLFTVCLRSKLCYSAVDRLVSVTIIFKYLKVILSTLDLTNCLQNHTINRRPESRPHPMSMSMSMSTLK